jgi:hypothetical protein
MKVAVAGGGWYGCHIALTLKNLGAEVRLFEQNSSLFQCASSNNQFRLHRGFHYARNARTRCQSRDGFLFFRQRYPFLLKEVEQNYYLVPESRSILDFETYTLIMRASGIDFDICRESPPGVRNISGAIKTAEAVLRVTLAKEYFESHLADVVCFETKVESVNQQGDSVWVNNEKFDYLIDCTWGCLLPVEEAIFYEPSLLLYYKRRGSQTIPALTFVDGDLCALYPTELTDYYTLSSVIHTPLGQFAQREESEKCIRDVSESLVTERRRLMEEEIRHYYPGFLDQLKYVGPQLSQKTKIVGDSGDRSCYVEQSGRSIVVLSGKIDTIFYAMDQILWLIGTHDPPEADSEESLIADQIRQVNARFDRPA